MIASKIIELKETENRLLTTADMDSLYQHSLHHQLDGLKALVKQCEIVVALHHISETEDKKENSRKIADHEFRRLLSQDNGALRGI